MRADTVGPGHRADYGRRTRPVQRGSGGVEPIMADAAGLSRRSRGVRAGLGRITPCLRRVRLVRASPPRRPGGPPLRLRQVSQKSPVHPLLGLTPPAPKRSVPLEFRPIRQLGAKARSQRRAVRVARPLPPAVPLDGATSELSQWMPWAFHSPCREPRGPREGGLGRRPRRPVRVAREG